VLNYALTPTDERSYVTKCLEKVWLTPGRNVITEAIYTDNIRSDKAIIEKCFISCYPSSETIVSIIQDIYHAEQRVLRMMPKYNYNYFSAC